MVKFITNTLIIITFCIVTFCTSKTTAAHENTLTLTIEFEKIKQLQGNLIIELYDLSMSTSQNWHEIQPLAHQSIALKTFEQTFQFNQLAVGRYAIRVFQDLNNNQLLDKTTNNLPLEPVGFSRNPSLFNGEPTIQDCAITLNKDNTTSITLRHRKLKRKQRH